LKGFFPYEAVWSFLPWPKDRSNMSCLPHGQVYPNAFGLALLMIFTRKLAFCLVMCLRLGNSQALEGEGLQRTPKLLNKLNCESKVKTVEG